MNSKYFYVVTTKKYDTPEKVIEAYVEIGGWERESIKAVYSMVKTPYAYEIARDYAWGHVDDCQFLGDDYLLAYVDEIGDDLEKVEYLYQIEWVPTPTNYEIMVGLNDKDTHAQEVETGDAVEVVGSVLHDCTIQECTGFYKGEKETSLKATVYGGSWWDIKRKAKRIRRILNQECVIVTDIKQQESKFLY